MSVSQHERQSDAAHDSQDARVTTVISCPGVRPMARQEFSAGAQFGANENRWYDRAGLRRRAYANIAGLMVAMAMLGAGVWIVTEFVRLQKIEACFEAGRRDCMPLDMQRRTKVVTP